MKKFWKMKIKYLFVFVTFILLIIIAGLAKAQITPSSPDLPKEEIYSDLKTEGDHVHGYRLVLNPQQNGKYTATLHVFDGNEEPFIVPLDSFNFDEKTAKVIFSGKFTSGTHYCPQHNGVPQEETVSFTGDWQWAVINGALTRQSLLHPETKKTEQVSFGQENK